MTIYERDVVPAIRAFGQAMSTELGMSLFLALYRHEAETRRRRDKAFDFHESHNRRLSKRYAELSDDATWSAGVESGVRRALLAYIADVGNVTMTQAEHQLMHEMGTFTHDVDRQTVNAMLAAHPMALDLSRGISA